MGRIFISYRREDSLDVAGRIFDRLTAHFGRDSVFMDVDTIPFGVDFRTHLSQWIESCDLVLVVIGERWVDVAYADGPKQDTRRLDDPADFVRIEVSTALTRDAPVVPVLVGRGQMPAPRELPDELESLAYRNAAEVRSGRDFHAHMDRLIRAIEQVVDSPESRAESEPELEPARVEPQANEEVTLADLLSRRVAIPEPVAVHIVLRAFDQLDVEEPRFDPRRVVLGPPTAEPIPYNADEPIGEPVGDYSAPRGELGDRGSSAVYAAGQILWELLMGRPAFTGTPARVRAAKRRQSTPLVMPQAPYAVSPETQQLIYRATTPHPSSRLGVLELIESAAQIAPKVVPPEVVTPVNLSFGGEIAAGYPHGWCNSLGFVGSVSPSYDFQVEERDGRRCVRIFRRGASGEEFGSLMQRFPAPYLAGRSVRLRAEVATDDVTGWAGLWLRIDGDQTLFFENMYDRAIRGDTPWTRHEIEVIVPDGARWMNFGILLDGDGTVRVSDFDLKVWTFDSKWQSLAWETLIA